MFKTKLFTTALLYLALCFTAPAFAEDDATMHQVYLAAQAGKFNEAQAMMDKVLRDHPNSAKAHFVEAELLAKQGQLIKAGDELSAAERLEPGLSFVKPETLQKLKGHIASAANGVKQPNVIQPNVVHQNTPAFAKDSMPTILLILGIGLIVLFIIFILGRRNANKFPAKNYAGNAPGSNMPPMGAGMGQPAAGGMGSGIMGNLATGAAMGAGVVAGEALMHHFIDGDKNKVVPEHDNSDWTSASNVNDFNTNDDLGGTDFGVADASSWDDAESGDSDGGDDWT
jgi:hypothetical protein